MRRRKHRPARTREVENGPAAFIADDRLLMLAAFPTAAPPAYLSRLVAYVATKEPSAMALEGAANSRRPRDRSRRSLILPALHKQEQLSGSSAWWSRKARRDGRIAEWGEKIITALTENGPS
jgi:hypothetical protein